MKNNPDYEYLYTLKAIQNKPVFILGLHRSGTSILYTMLTAIGSFNPVTAYHLINYNELLTNHFQKKEQQAKKELTTSFKTQNLNDRGIDRLSLTANFAEEYGFLLGQQTILMKLNNKNFLLFNELMQKIQLISENTNPILLKNPFDFPNFLYIKKMIPQAKFIFIHRHPFNILSSTMNAIQFLLKEKNSYTAALSPLYIKLYKNPISLFFVRCCFLTFSAFGMILLTLSTRSALRSYSKNIFRLSKEDYVAVTYEDLCKNPEKTMMYLMNFLNIIPKQSVDFCSMVKPRMPPLEKNVRQFHKFIYWCLKPYFIAFGYRQISPEKNNNE